MSSLSVLKQDSIFSLDMLSFHLWFDLGYRQIKLSPKDYLDDVSTGGVSL
jgi:hypothetical protein